MKSYFDRLVFVDCEAWGGCPAVGQLTEYAGVTFKDGAAFHGILVKSQPSKENPAIPERGEKVDPDRKLYIFNEFDKFLSECVENSPVFMSDNPAYDWQWINEGFWTTINRNPFGHSARRIGDFYAGLQRDFASASAWKKYRVTKHDHNPVNDARGNIEAFKTMLQLHKIKY